MATDAIVTNVYRIGASAYVRRLLSAWLWRWWWALALPMCAAIFAGLYDWRWWVAGVALALVAYPGVLAIVYYYYALSPDAVRAILPQHASFTAEGVTFTYLPLDEDCTAPAPRFISWTDVSQWEDSGSSLLLRLRGAAMSSLEVPFSAFQSRDHQRAVLDLLEKCVKMP